MKRLTQICFAAVCLCAPIFLSGHAQARVDSFFDVFFDVTYDSPSQSPVITAQGVVRQPGSKQYTVDTEMVALSLTSTARGGDNTRHTVTLMYGVQNIGSSGEDGVRFGYAELDVICKVRRAAGKCEILTSKPISESEFHGHVTVLK